jgi:hypothetical protein
MIRSLLRSAFAAFPGAGRDHQHTIVAVGSLLLLVSSSVLGCADVDPNSEGVAPATSALASCPPESSSPVCNPDHDPETSQLSIVSPVVGGPSWGAAADLKAKWIGAAGKTSTLVWTITFDPDGAGPQLSQTLTLASGTLSSPWVSGNLVPFNSCVETPATITIRGRNAMNVLVSSSVPIGLENEACWIN